MDTPAYKDFVSAAGTNVGAQTENLHHLSSLDYLFKTIEDRYLDFIKLKKDIRNGAHAIKEIGQSICTLMGLALPKTK